MFGKRKRKEKNLADPELILSLDTHICKTFEFCPPLGHSHCHLTGPELKSFDILFSNFNLCLKLVSTTNPPPPPRATHTHTHTSLRLFMHLLNHPLSTLDALTTREPLPRYLHPQFVYAAAVPVTTRTSITSLDRTTHSCTV